MNAIQYNTREIRRLSVTPEDVRHAYTIYLRHNPEAPVYDLDAEINLDAMRGEDLVAAVKCVQQLDGLAVDGKLGPATRQAAEARYDSYGLEPTWTDLAELLVGADVARLLSGAAHKIGEALSAGNAQELTPFQPADGRVPYPRKMAALTGIFGDSMANPKAYARKHIITCHAKGERPSLPGIPAKWYFKIHRDIEPYLREALRRFEATGSKYQITRAGGYVPRFIRHDPARGPSTHAWGIALDINARWNKAIVTKEDIEPFSARYWELWPGGVPKELVDAMESCGFFWGFHFRGFKDPMHFQWCGLSEEQYPG